MSISGAYDAVTPFGDCHARDDDPEAYLAQPAKYLRRGRAAMLPGEPGRRLSLDRVFQCVR